MSSYTISLLIDIQSPANFSVHRTTSKLDSITESVFQRIGLAYREFDVIASRIFHNQYAAKAHLVASLLNSGLSKDRSELLLAATNWEDRMQLAWTFLQASDRRKAKSLDYNAIENYWPSLNFLDAKWPPAFKPLQAA